MKKEMITLDACPRCGGAILDYGTPIADSPMCITCGWRKVNVPQDVIDEVEEHMGKAFMEDRYTHKQIGTGKPPLSGWEREKRRREREQQTGQQHLAAS
jgi:hypothetical protein